MVTVEMQIRYGVSLGRAKFQLISLHHPPFIPLSFLPPSILPHHLPPSFYPSYITSILLSFLHHLHPSILPHPLPPSFYSPSITLPPLPFSPLQHLFIILPVTLCHFSSFSPPFILQSPSNTLPHYKHYKPNPRVNQARINQARPNQACVDQARGIPPSLHPSISLPTGQVCLKHLIRLSNNTTTVIYAN